MASGQRAVRELLSADRRPTAIIAANDLMALGALGELKRAGLRVPSEISVPGCDDISLAGVTDPPLTTIAGGGGSCTGNQLRGRGLPRTGSQVKPDWSCGNRPARHRTYLRVCNRQSLMPSRLEYLDAQKVVPS